MDNGLLDFFGKDYEDPRTQGLLQFGLGLMEAGGYQNRPVSMGQALGMAGKQGMGAYQAAVQEQQRKEQLASQKEMQGLQKSQIEFDLAAKQASIESTRKANLAKQRLANFDKMVASGGGMLPQGMDVEAERIKLFAEAYPTEYAKYIAQQFSPQKPIPVTAGTTLYDPTSKKAIFTAPEKDAATTPPASTKGGVVKMDVTDSQGNKIGTRHMQQTLVLDPNSPTGYKQDEIGNALYEYKPISSVTKVGDPEPSLKPIDNAVYLGPDGLENKTVYEKKNEKGILSYYVVGENGEEVPISKDDFLSEEELERQTLDFGETRDEFLRLEEEKSGITAIEDLITEIGKASPSGIARYKDKVAGDIKAILGGKLSEQEKAQKIMVALQQGMLGKVRVDVLGPGVLTENDAQRLIKYLGGNLESITTSPEVVIEALTRLSAEKKGRFDSGARMANYNIKRIARADEMGRRGGMSLFTLYTPDPIQAPVVVNQEARDFANTVLGKK